MPKASAHAADPVTPSGRWVSAVPVLKNRGCCGWFSEPQSLACPIDEQTGTEHFPGFLLSFPRPLKVPLSTGTRGYFCSKQSGKVYFCIVLGEFVVGFLFTISGQITQQKGCAVSPCLSSHHQLILESWGETLRTRRLFRVAACLPNQGLSAECGGHL